MNDDPARHFAGTLKAYIAAVLSGSSTDRLFRRLEIAAERFRQYVDKRITELGKQK